MDPWKGGARLLGNKTVNEVFKLQRTVCGVNGGIKHDFPFINIRKVPTLRMLMNDKIMFDRYYCINSAKHCENEENIGALYLITSSHFPTRVRF